jgi:hypothetical protein
MSNTETFSYSKLVEINYGTYKFPEDLILEENKHVEIGYNNTQRVLITLTV